MQPQLNSIIEKFVRQLSNEYKPLLESDSLMEESLPRIQEVQSKKIKRHVSQKIDRRPLI